MQKYVLGLIGVFLFTMAFPPMAQAVGCGGFVNYGGDSAVGYHYVTFTTSAPGAPYDLSCTDDGGAQGGTCGGAFANAAAVNVNGAAYQLSVAGNQNASCTFTCKIQNLLGPAQAPCFIQTVDTPTGTPVELMEFSVEGGSE